MQESTAPPWRLVDPREVRSCIARRWLASRDPRQREQRLGEIALRPHQAAAVERIRRSFAEFGGALLADATGLGKTYVALAIARDVHDAVVVAPAALRPMWLDAMRRAGVVLPVVSHEALSRAGDVALGAPRLVIVDEAHHARNPATRRHARLAALCAGARVLLLSATPIHNRHDDLVALLSLFLGERAARLDDTELARVVVRRSRAAGTGIPDVRPTDVLPLTHDDRMLEAILALPPPVPPADGGDGGALVAWTLVRQWASSEAALAGALRRRLQRAASLEAALDAGRHPTVAELGAWTVGDDAVQLAFPELMAGAPGTRDLLAAVRTHAGALRALLARLDGRSDEARVRLLRDLRRRHPGERIVAFSAFADTVHVLFRRLVAMREPGVAALSGEGAIVAGGPLGRADALRRFAPRAHGAREPADAERITLLLATDLLSEGVNLQDASVVVHLDMPWTPARLEQRVGRAARQGSLADHVSVYALGAPDAAERLLEVERRLRDKAMAAARGVGVVGAILPGAAGGPVVSESPSALTEQLETLLRHWVGDGLVSGDDEDSVLRVALCDDPRSGALVLCRTGDDVDLVAIRDGQVSGDPAALLDVARRASHGAALTSDAAGIAARAGARVAEARLAIARWHRSRLAGEVVGLQRAPSSAARRAILSRAARILRRAPLHARSSVEPLVAAARVAATLRCGAGLERVLEELAGSPLPDDRWLRALAEFARLHAAPVAERTDVRTPAPIAMLLLGDRSGRFAPDDQRSDSR